MIEILGFLFGVFFLIFLFTIEQTIENRRNKKVLSMIGECFYNRLNISSNNKHNLDGYLADCARHFQYTFYEPAEYNSGVDEIYRIAKDEKEIALDIVKTYQQWLLKLYVLGQYRNFTLYSDLDHELFLLCIFKDFLASHNGNSFNDRDMYIVKYKEDKTRICFLTEYAKVFYKMYYTTTLYVENKRPSKDGTVSHYKSDALKKILDKGFV